MELSKKFKFYHEPHEHHELLVRHLVVVRDGSAHCRSPKGDLALFQTAAFIGATLCDIIAPHGFAVRLFSGFVVEILLLGHSQVVKRRKCG
jgi:hypothetical protein